MLFIVIDELADLIDVSSDAEGHLVRLAQKARSAGMYLLLATQRPDAKTLSGRLRDTCRPNCVENRQTPVSEIILGERGAENLTAKGDHWSNGTMKQHVFCTGIMYNLFNHPCKGLRPSET